MSIGASIHRFSPSDVAGIALVALGLLGLTLGAASSRRALRVVACVLLVAFGVVLMVRAG